MAPGLVRANSSLKALLAADRTIFTRLRSRTMATGSSALSSPLTLSNSSATKIPKLVYGTAWKKDRTADLVYQAVRAGFRGFDTAAQPRHYQEHLVGDGIRRAVSEGIVKREDLYIQTKFTGLSGQDPQNMPYLASSPLEERIHSSLMSSFFNLRPTSSTNPDEVYLDCLVLHSPLPTLAETHLAWSIFSSYVPHRIRSLGISNTTISVLQSLFSSQELSVKPSVVQNKFYPDTDWEVPLRRFCRERAVIFQSFWTFTGNPSLMGSDLVGKLATEIAKIGIPAPEAEVVALYCLVLGLEGVSILDGTTKGERMKGDLEGLELVGAWAEVEGRETWKECLDGFRRLIGQA